MTVAYDAFGQAANNSAGTTSPVTWTHTPVGTPAGVVVMVQLEDFASADRTITGVTYGGVALAADSASPLTGGENANQKAWIYTLYAGIPTGAQTVSVSFNAGPGTGVNARSVTLTGTSLETHARATSDSVTANPKINVTTVAAHDSVIIGLLNSGQDAAASIAVDANTTAFGGFNDVGATQHCFARKTATVTGGNSDGPGFTIASEDALMYAIAVAEVVAAGTPRRHRMGMIRF